MAAGVAEQDAAGAVLVKQLAHLRVIVGHGFDSCGDLLVIGLFRHKRSKVGKARRIQQTQQGKVVFLPQLFGSGGQQQQTLGRSRERFQGFVGAGNFLAQFAGIGCGQFAERDVVRLIHNTQIPACGLSCFGPLRFAGKQAQRAQYQLRGRKRIVLTAFLQSLTTFLIQQSERQIKTTQHLHQPLMQEGFWHHY